MADEAVVEAGKEAGEVKAEPKKEEVQAGASEQASELKQQLEAQSKAVKIFNDIDQRYRTDPEFRENFDNLWNGKLKAAVASDAAADLDPIDQLRQELQEAKKGHDDLKGKLAQLQDIYGYDKVLTARQSINVRYDTEFQKLAAGVGYEPGSPAFDILYADTAREGNALARKYGLVDENGTPDPLKEHKPELIKEAFKSAFDRHKQAGFDQAWDRKKKAMAEEKKTTYKDDMEQYFDPKKLKTPSDRAKALELAFKHKYGNNLKIV